MKFFRFATVIFALSGMALICAARQIPLAPKTNAITGRVVDENGSPLAYARVSANEAEARGPNRISRSTITDDEGYFRLSGLPPGDYSVSAYTEGHLNGYALGTEGSAQDNRYFRPGASVTITLKKGAVITGRVTDAEDRAVVAVPIILESARDQHDRPVAGSWVEKEGWTDDRGVYRIFGLRPGSYLIRAGGRSQQNRGTTAFDAHAPTYYPSSARENATEVKVAAGEEATGIDIRYRGERGYAIRGIVAGVADFNHPPYVRLNRPLGGPGEFTFLHANDQLLKFEFEGLPDGEYDLTAGRGYSSDDDGAGSAPRRVTIKGADMDGIELRIVPFGSISGRFILAADSTDCQILQRRRLTDISPILQRDGADHPVGLQERPDQQGAFAIRGLEPGRYRLAAWLPHREWFLRSITQPGPAPANRPPTNRHVDVSRQGLTLQPGERKTGLVVTVAEGAAFLSGKVISSTEGASLPSGLRVYLVPAEPASADDALRYAEAEMEGDGKFMVSHLAPGRYYLLARAAINGESSEAPPRPTPWSAENRAKLLREARATKAEVELKACQRVMDYALRYESR